MKAMRLTLIAAAVGALSAPAFAAPALEVYGKINITLESAQIENGLNSDGTTKYTKDNWEAKSNASRFGVKGELPINDDGLKAIYVMEWGVDTTDRNAASDSNSDGNFDKAENITSRNQWVGLEGGFGKTLIGRYDLQSKLIQAKVDMFHDFSPEMQGLFKGKVRANNLWQYSTPSMGGFVANVQTVLQEKVDTKASDTDNKQDGLFDATSISLEYSIGGLWVAYGQDDGIDLDGKYNSDAKLQRLVAQYKWNALTFGAEWQKYNEGDNVGTVLPAPSACVTEAGDSAGTVIKHPGDSNKNCKLDSPTGLMFNVAYKINDEHTIKFQHATSDVVTEGGEQNSFGYDYKMAKNVTLLAFYSKQTRDTDHMDQKYLAGGIEVKF